MYIYIYIYIYIYHSLSPDGAFSGATDPGASANLTSLAARRADIHKHTK